MPTNTIDLPSEMIDKVRKELFANLVHYRPADMAMALAHRMRLKP